MLGLQVHTKSLALYVGAPDPSSGCPACTAKHGAISPSLPVVLRLEHVSEPCQAAVVPTEPGSAGLRGGLGTGGLDRTTGVSNGQPDGEALVRELARISGPKPYKL